MSFTSLRFAHPLPAVEPLEQRNLLDAAGFVRGLYAGVLHRTPAQAEVDGWVGAINAGASRVQVVDAFSSSTEHRTEVIVEDYQRFLGRAPEAGAIKSWLGVMQSGATEDQVQSKILASDEYFQKHGANSQDWTRGVYQDLLGRKADQAEVTGWVQALGAGRSRDQAATQFEQSTEEHAREVIDVYHSLLNREPDQAGEKSWVDALDHGMNHDQLIAGIATSSEFESEYSNGSGT